VYVQPGILCIIRSPVNISEYTVRPPDRDLVAVSDPRPVLLLQSVALARFDERLILLTEKQTAFKIIPHDLRFYERL
jgi:hypothetical protein